MLNKAGVSSKYLQWVICRVWLALEYKGIDYDTMLIDLRNKPQWFTELAPRGQVPVAKIKDRLLTESKEILLVHLDSYTLVSLVTRSVLKALDTACHHSSAPDSASLLMRIQ